LFENALLLNPTMVLLFTSVGFHLSSVVK